MRALKKLALATAIASAPFAANALEALDDEFLGDVTGQEGISIDKSYTNTIEEFQYIDGDGDGSSGAAAGKVKITDIRVGNYSNRRDMIDLDGSGTDFTLGEVMENNLRVDATENGVLITGADIGFESNTVTNTGWLAASPAVQAVLGGASGATAAAQAAALTTASYFDNAGVPQGALPGMTPGALIDGSPLSDATGQMIFQVDASMTGTAAITGNDLTTSTAGQVGLGALAPAAGTFVSANDYLVMQTNTAIIDGGSAAINGALVGALIAQPNGINDPAAAAAFLGNPANAGAVAGLTNAMAGSIIDAAGGTGGVGGPMDPDGDGQLGLTLGGFLTTADSAAGIAAGTALRSEAAALRGRANGKDTFIGGIEIGNAAGASNSIGSLMVIDQTNYAPSSSILVMTTKFGIGANNIVALLNNNANKFIEGQMRISSKNSGTGVNITTEASQGAGAIVYTDTDGTGGNQIGLIGLSQFRLTTQDDIDGVMDNANGTYFRGVRSGFDLDVEDGKVVLSNQFSEGNTMINKIFIGDLSNAAKFSGASDVVGSIAIIGNRWNGSTSLYAH